MISRCGARRSLPSCLVMILCACSALQAPRATGFESGAAPQSALPASGGEASSRVVHISVDGLRGGAIEEVGPLRAPHFYRLRIEGAFTENARSDYDITVTLPNHACLLTGRPALGPDGHGVHFNSDDGRTFEAAHGSYVPGVFDVAHDHGLRTGLYASKSKFALFDRSWNEANGAPDARGVDNGRDKIDAYVYRKDIDELIDSFVVHMDRAPYRYAFIHLVDPDEVGHSYGWESANYLEAIVKVDALLGRILDLIEGDIRFAGATYLVVTADHGGRGTSHGDAADPLNYTVPFYVWGPGVPAGADLYRLNRSTRMNPGDGRPPQAAAPPPIRNSESANLSLDLLGLPPVPGSVIDAAQDCVAALPEGADALPGVTITNPIRGARFERPSPVVIEAVADPRGGAVARVEFFAEGIWLGADSTPPYRYSWNEAPLGSCRLTVRAVRDDGAAATASVEIEIGEAAER